LSNDTRMGVLQALNNKPLRLTMLSKELDLPAQEVSRQLSRLEKVNLTRKDANGFYSLTPYASALLKLLPSYTFLTENRVYFTNHSIDDLPIDFIGRIGELDKCRPIPDVMMSFHYTEEVIKNSTESIMIISDQILMSTLPLLSERIDHGVKFRLVAPKNFELAQPVKAFFKKHNEASPKESWGRSSRFTDHLNVTMVVSESEIGLLSFPSSIGTFDYLGFRSSDSKAVIWAIELFEKIWKNASKDIPNQIERAYE